MGNSINIVIYKRNFLRSDWRQDLDLDAISCLVKELNTELRQFDWHIGVQLDELHAVDVCGYGDLLNAVRLRATGSALGNPCLGHVIGASAACDPVADIKRGINRIIFAPETIEPDVHNKRICHNCGCGC